jgi:hypothetical protein
MRIPVRQASGCETSDLKRVGSMKPGPRKMLFTVLLALFFVALFAAVITMYDRGMPQAPVFLRRYFLIQYLPGAER